MPPSSPLPPVSIDVDRELNLKELLSGFNQQRLLDTLERILEAPAFVLDQKGECLLGLPTEDTPNSTPIYGELEAIGRLYADTSTDKLKTASEMIQLLLYANARYLMASQLHLQSQYTDYEALQRKHAALEQSELRYKTLSENLQQHVKKQIKTIQATQLRLYESEKLASVGRLAAGMAHEINNPLGFIRSNLASGLSYLGLLSAYDSLIHSGASLDRLRQAWSDQSMRNMLDDLKDIFHESIEGVERIADIIKDLKRFSIMEVPKQTASDVNEIIRQTCQIAEPRLGEHIKLFQNLSPNIPPVYCHAISLGEVFHHLLLNAIDAIPEHGKISFKTSMNADKLLIEVRDNGCGIAKSDLPHVFEAFYSNKEIGKRMGLGLTICHHIINAHKGDIQIKSKPEFGTLVQIQLPLSQMTDKT